MPLTVERCSTGGAGLDYATMHLVRHLLTPRLQLDAVAAGDPDEHVALVSDPGVWAHLPSGRHTNPSTTARDLDRGVEQWDRVAPTDPSTEHSSRVTAIG